MMKVAATTFNYGCSNYDVGTDVIVGVTEAAQCKCCEGYATQVLRTAQCGDG